MLTLEQITLMLTQHKAELRNEFRVKQIGIFGSYRRGEQTDASDVDVLVEFEDGCKTFDAYMNLKFHLEKLLGRNVDLLLGTGIREELKPYILPEVFYV